MRRIDVDARFLQHPISQSAVVIVTTQCRVAAGRQDLKYTRAQAQDRDIKRATTQVIHGVHTLGGVVQAIGQRGGGGFVDQAQHVQAGELRGVFGGLALRVVKVGRHGDDRAKNIVGKAVFGAKTQGGQNFGADLDRGFFTGDGAHADHARRVDQGVGQARGVGHIGQAAAHQAFDRSDGVAGVVALLRQRVKPDLAALRVQVAHHAGQDDAALVIGQAFRHAVAHGSDQRMRGSQVDAHSDATPMRVGRLPGFGNLQQRHTKKESGRIVRRPARAGGPSRPARICQ